MARARNIKPGFFKNEILGVADPLYSLLFEGLWVLADRSGRLEDRPLRIKGEVFPYRDGLNVDAMLNWLESNGFIRRYTAQGKKCILVLEFVKHQNPHKNETESELPAPSDERTQPEEIGTVTEIIGSTRADSLSSDSLIPDPLTEAKASSSSAKPDALPPCPHAELIDLFGQHLPMLPQPKVEAWSGARAKALQTRWRWVLTAKKRDGTRYATNRNEALAWFSRYFNFVARSDFLSGRDGKWTGCDLGWLANETNFAKVIQGNYDNRELEAA